MILTSAPSHTGRQHVGARGAPHEAPAGYGAFLMDRPEHLRLCVAAIAAAVRRTNPAAACLCKVPPPPRLA